MGTDVIGTGLPWVDAINASFAQHDFVEFHEHTLPGHVLRRGHVVARDLDGVPSIAFRAGDHTYTWYATSEGLAVSPGDDGAVTLVELSGPTFSEWVDELLTANGAFRTGRATVVRGDLTGWQRWEPAFQSLCSGRSIYSPAVWDTLVDRSGAPLDLSRTFTADDDPEEMRHFLHAAGFLHLKRIFDAEQVAHYGAEVARAMASSTPGDPFSWWSVNAADEEVVTRINYLGRFSDDLQQLSFDPRLLQYARLADPDMRVCDDRLDGPMVFVKHSDVVKGNGDLGWHVDDGIGGHPVMCPLIQTGIQLDHATPENGQLLVLAGSHRYAKHWIEWGDEGDLPAVALVTEPGDLTLHFGDTMHTTPPPTAPGAGRRALYYKFSLPKTFEWVPAGCHYNDALFRVGADGRSANRAAS